ncbi:MAG: hypothetical protein Q4Q07_09820 [Tissierellia bacterium]|nr:hypothetical protein [Tissierellia bacterium]
MSGFDDRIVIPKNQKDSLKDIKKKSPKPNYEEPPRKDGCGCLGCLGGCFGILVFFLLLLFIFYYLFTREILTTDFITGEQLQRAVEILFELIKEILSSMINGA